VLDAVAGLVVGAMQNWTPRELDVDFPFCRRNFRWSYQDGVNADRSGSDYKQVKGQVNKTTKLKLSWRPEAGGREIHP